MHEIQELSTLNKLKQDQIQQLEMDKVKLTQEMENLKYKTEPTSFELHQELQSKLEYKESEIQVLKESNQLILKEKLELESNNKSFRTLVSQEESEKRKVLQAEMKKIESDMMRIRKTRESMKTSLDFKTAKEGNEQIKYSETKKLYEAQKERIKSLETDLQRLFMLISKDNGDKVLMDFFYENGPMNPFEHWRNQLNEQSIKMKEMQIALEAFQQASHEIQSRQQVLVKESELQSQIMELQSKLERYESLGDSNLTEKEKEISRLKDQIDFYEKVSPYSIHKNTKSNRHNPVLYRKFKI